MNFSESFILSSPEISFGSSVSLSEERVFDSSEFTSIDSNIGLTVSAKNVSDLHNLFD